MLPTVWQQRRTCLTSEVLAPSKTKQKNKINFSKAIVAPRVRPPEPRKKLEIASAAEKNNEEVLSEDSDDEKRVPKRRKVTRLRFKNYKKLDLAREVREKNPFYYQEQWKAQHPAVMLNTVTNWISSKKFAGLEHDGLHESRQIRNAFVRSTRLEFFQKGQYPRYEEMLYEKFLEHRKRMLTVPLIWFRLKMKKLLRQLTPGEEERKNFSASTSW